MRSMGRGTRRSLVEGWRSRKQRFPRERPESSLIHPSTTLRVVPLPIAARWGGRSAPAPASAILAAGAAGVVAVVARLLVAAFVLALPLVEIALFLVVGHGLLLRAGERTEAGRVSRSRHSGESRNPGTRRLESLR